MINYDHQKSVWMVHGYYRNFSKIDEYAQMSVDILDIPAHVYNGDHTVPISGKPHLNYERT